MILLSTCNSCLTRFEILVEPKDIGLIKQVADASGNTAPCPRLCGGRINLTGNPILDTVAPMMKEPLHLTATQYFQAVKGLGLPDEIPHDKDVITALLRAYAVVDTVLQEDNGKFYLHEIHLSNGIILHLGAGLRGAIVIKITKPHEAPHADDGDS